MPNPTRSKRVSDPAELSLYTCSYHEIDRAGRVNGVPVRTSQGRPRIVDHELPVCRGIMPSSHLLGQWKKMTPTEWDAKYIDVLDAKAEQIDRELMDLHDEYGGRPLVLCCFERDVKDCHRLIFANWWERRYGTAVPELGPE
jgi:uncharacterized protein YeaO (DUF488 family)